MPKQNSTPEGRDVKQRVGAVQRPATDEEFWRRTEAYMPKTKQGVFVRLDADVLGWLKAKGKGYQTRMNAMLRVLMESDRTTPSELGEEIGLGLPIVIDIGAAAPVSGDQSGLGLPLLLDTVAAAPLREMEKPGRRGKPRVA